MLAPPVFGEQHCCRFAVLIFVAWNSSGEHSHHGLTMTDSSEIKLHTPSSSKEGRRFIEPWMVKVLTFAGWYNIVAGLSMMILYHEGFKMLGVTKPEMNLPIQLVGMLVAVFGVGYLIAAKKPVENRNILLLGFFSKLFGPLLAMSYIVSGQLPVAMIPILIFADIAYLAPFWMIYRECGRIADATEIDLVLQQTDVDTSHQAESSNQQRVA